MSALRTVVAFGRSDIGLETPWDRPGQLYLHEARGGGNIDVTMIGAPCRHQRWAGVRIER
jgi:hypothetical protein